LLFSICVGADGIVATLDENDSPADEDERYMCESREVVQQGCAW